MKCKNKEVLRFTLSWISSFTRVCDKFEMCPHELFPILVWQSILSTQISPKWCNTYVSTHDTLWEAWGLFSVCSGFVNIIFPNMPPCWIPIICSQSTILVDPRKSKIIPNLPNTKRWPLQITITTGREPTGNGRKSFRNWMETQENKRKRPRSDWTVWKRTSVVEIEQNRLITGANVRSRTEPSGSVRWIELSGFFERHLIRFLNDFWDQYRRYSAK